MPRITVQELTQSLLGLWERRDEQNIERTLKVFIQQAPNQFAFEEALNALIALPPELRQATVGIKGCFLRIACGANDPSTLSEWLEHETPGRFLLFEGWLCLKQGKPEQALEVFGKLDSWSSDWEKGFWWRLQGEALAQTHAPVEVWVSCFVQARTLLKDRYRGLCLVSEGWCHWNAGDLGSARRLWSLALLDLKSDAYYTAWVHQNLGMMLLHSQPLEAERQFQSMLQWSRKKEGQKFQSRAMAGIAASRRVLGELNRAAFAYQQAVDLAKKGKGDADDLEQALWGLGLCNRLMGSLEVALEHYNAADQASDKNWVRVDLAALWVGMGDAVGALQVLQQSRAIQSREHNLHWVVMAEAKRLQGQDPSDALGNLNFKAAFLAEEALFFPALFAKARQLGFPEVQALTPVVNRIEVFASGVLKVKVNGRDVPLDSRGLPGLVLVFLLESGGRATTEQLAEVIFEEPQSGKKVRQTVWGHIEKLREALGWNASIVFKEGAYQLDEHAQWWYDIHEMLNTKGKIRAFMSGHYQRWVHEQQQVYDVLD